MSSISTQKNLITVTNIPASGRGVLWVEVIGKIAPIEKFNYLGTGYEIRNRKIVLIVRKS